MYFKNEVTVEGFLADKPVIKENKNQKKFCFFTVCYNENHKEADGWKSVPHFFRCTAWGYEAESAAEFEKGQAVSVLGKLTQREWTDEKGGRHNQTSVLAFHVRKLEVNKKEKLEETPVPQSEELEIPDSAEIPEDKTSEIF